MSAFLLTWESYCDEKCFQIGLDANFWLFDEMT